jgi:hypothetical protein
MAEPKSKPKAKKAKDARESGSDAPDILPALADQTAGYHVGGSKLATLKEVLDPGTPTMSLAELTEQQRVDLAIARLRSKPDDFQIVMIGPGAINKARAIAEVEARSRVGRTLMEIEQLLISTLTEPGDTRG